MNDEKVIERITEQLKRAKEAHPGEWDWEEWAREGFMVTSELEDSGVVTRVCSSRNEEVIQFLAYAPENIQALIAICNGRAREIYALTELLHDAGNDVAKFWAGERLKGRKEAAKLAAEFVGMDVENAILKALPELTEPQTTRHMREEIEQLRNTVLQREQEIKKLQGSLLDLQDAVRLSYATGSVT